MFAHRRLRQTNPEEEVHANASVQFLWEEEVDDVVL
jgi:hypothetical protein